MTKKCLFLALLTGFLGFLWVGTAHAWYTPDYLAGLTCSDSDHGGTDTTCNKAVDGNVNTHYLSNNTSGFPHWISFDTVTGRRTASVEIYTEAASGHILSKDFELYGSNDNANWELVHFGNPPTFTYHRLHDNAESFWQSIDFVPLDTSYRYLKINFLNSFYHDYYPSDTEIAILEMKAFECPTSGFIPWNCAGAPPPEATSTITFIDPTATTTQDFYNWVISYSVPSTTPAYEVVFSYSQGDYPIYTDEYWLAHYSTSTMIAAFHKNYPLALGNWIATGKIVDETNDPFGSVATTSISFTITTYGGGTTTTPPTATTTPITITCDPSSGFFQYSFCYLFQYLFVPTPSSVSQFIGIKDLVINKPPLGYFTLLNADFHNLSTSTPAYSLATINSPYIQAIKDGMALVLWFAFGVFTIIRFKHLNL